MIFRRVEGALHGLLVHARVFETRILEIHHESVHAVGGLNAQLKRAVFRPAAVEEFQAVQRFLRSCGFIAVYWQSGTQSFRRRKRRMPRISSDQIRSQGRC